MREELINVDKFVDLNNLEEITNPIMLDKSFAPTPDGILSTQIFGASVKTRRTTFAYINLNCHVLQPIAYRTFKRLDRRIVDIISGTKKFIIDKTGALVEDEEKGDTGSEWLYKNWNKLKFPRNDSMIRNRRIDFFESFTRDELFQSKAIVCPAFYRDINLQDSKQGKPSIHKVNGPYVKLIRLAAMLDQGNFTFSLNSTRFQIQETLVELYLEFKSRIEKKRGIIRQNILGKTIDYGARVVISVPKFMSNRPDEMIVDFDHVGVPIGHCISLFTPFFIGWIQQFLTRNLEKRGNKFPAKNKQGELRYFEIVNPLIQFNDTEIEHMMKTFKNSPSHRFDPVPIKTTDEQFPVINLKLKDLFESDETANLPDRVLTYTDLFYIAACDITKDKHVYVTRYPITSYNSTFPAKIRVLSTTETIPVTANGVEYKHYPVIDLNIPKSEIGYQFIEVTQMNNTLLNGIGGDYDGDQITLKSVFSQEANLEAEQLIMNPTNFISINGSNIRTSEIEAVQTLYSMTRWKNKNETMDYV